MFALGTLYSKVATTKEIPNKTISVVRSQPLINIVNRYCSTYFCIYIAINNIYVSCTTAILNHNNSYSYTNKYKPERFTFQYI